MKSWLRCLISTNCTSLDTEPYMLAMLLLGTCMQCLLRSIWWYTVCGDGHCSEDLHSCSVFQVFCSIPWNREPCISAVTSSIDAHLVIFAILNMIKIYAMSPSIKLVSHGKTLFHTEGKGLGHGHRAVCRPEPLSAYQSQHIIQSHDTWSMWLTGKFNFSVWVDSELEAWEVCWARSILSHKLEHSRNRNRECRKVASLTLAIAIAAIMTEFTWLIKYLGDNLLYGHVPDPFHSTL